MTYEDRELSHNEAAPVELYRFTIGVESWYYTSADEEIQYDGQSYSPVAISRSEVVGTDQVPKSGVDITAPMELGPVDRWRGAAPNQLMSVTIMRRHRPDDEARVIWRGRVLGVTFDEGEATLTAEGAMQALGRMGLRGQFHTGCRHMLYDDQCRVTSADHQRLMIVEEVSGRQITAEDLAEEPDGYWVGGYLNVGEGRIRGPYLITGHSGDTVTVQEAPGEIEPGNELRVYPGCDHTPQTCRDKFDNLTNFGGFPYIPDGTPFTGSILMK